VNGSDFRVRTFGEGEHPRWRRRGPSPRPPRWGRWTCRRHRSRRWKRGW